MKWNFSKRNDSEWDNSNLTGVNASDLLQYISGLKYLSDEFYLIEWDYSYLTSVNDIDYPSHGLKWTKF